MTAPISDEDLVRLEAWARNAFHADPGKEVLALIARLRLAEASLAKSPHDRHCEVTKERDAARAEATAWSNCVAQIQDALGIEGEWLGGAATLDVARETRALVREAAPLLSRASAEMTLGLAADIGDWLARAEKVGRSE
jgi:hypothetical protein